jgi:hypothetical protein
MALLGVDVDGSLSIKVTVDPVPNLHVVVPSVEDLLRPLHPPLRKDHAYGIRLLRRKTLHSLQFFEVHICQLIDSALVIDAERQGKLRSSALLLLDKDQQVIAYRHEINILSTHCSFSLSSTKYNDYLYWNLSNYTFRIP